MSANVLFINIFLYLMFELFQHMSFGLLEPLLPSFDLKTDLPTSNFTPDAATLTLHALELANNPQNIKIFFDSSKQKEKTANLGG